jgi:hypothetical protein
MEQLHADGRERVLDLRRQLHNDVTQRLAEMAARNIGVANFHKYYSRNKRLVYHLMRKYMNRNQQKPTEINRGMYEHRGFTNPVSTGTGDREWEAAGYFVVVNRMMDS